MHDIVVLLLLSINCYQPETLALNSAVQRRYETGQLQVMKLALLIN